MTALQTRAETEVSARRAQPSGASPIPRPRSLLTATRHRRPGGLRVVSLLALSLAACQTPAVQTRTVEVKIPVAVQPIKPAQVPAVPKPLGPRPQSLSAAADLLLAKHCEFVAYAILADPLLRVSAKMPPQALPPYPECEK
jgi:hypothetical protein